MFAITIGEVDNGDEHGGDDRQRIEAQGVDDMTVKHGVQSALCAATGTTVTGQAQP